MRRIWRESVRAGVAVLASASLALAPGWAGAQSQSGSDQVSNGAKQAGQGDAGTAKNGGKTARGAGGRSGPGAGDVGDRLHDSAKGFGEALLDGIKYAGRKVIGFFDGDKSTD
jgi:hypothetical protein